MQACMCSVGIRCWYARSECTDMCNRNYIQRVQYNVTHCQEPWQRFVVTGLRTERTFLLADAFSLYLFVIKFGSAISTPEECGIVLYSGVFFFFFFREALRLQTPENKSRRSGKTRREMTVRCAREMISKKIKVWDSVITSKSSVPLTVHFASWAVSAPLGSAV